MNRSKFASGFVAKKNNEPDQLPEEIPEGQFYKLDKRIVVPCDVIEWATFFDGNTNRMVASTNIGESHVSTVFLGLNHSFSMGKMAPPLLFETMIMSGEYEGDSMRCSTYAQAEEQHEKALRIVRGEIY